MRTEISGRRIVPSESRRVAGITVAAPAPQVQNGGVKRVAIAVVLLVVLGVASCGDDAPAPPPIEREPAGAEPTKPAVEVPEWAKVAPKQIAQARMHGVPVAFENDLGMRFVLIPAGHS